ncbi:MAG: hypothetical protein HQ481_18850 [Alphaproteobacteria bacterium]|nr:hypothetical protein [Alphaproteobacteria bacterium]
MATSTEGILSPNRALIVSVVIALAAVFKMSSAGLITIAAGLHYFYPLVFMAHIALCLGSSPKKRVSPRVFWLAHVSLLVNTAFFLDTVDGIEFDNAFNHLADRIVGIRPLFTGGGYVLYPFSALSLIGGLGLIGSWIAILAAPKADGPMRHPPSRTEDDQP